MSATTTPAVASDAAVARSTSVPDLLGNLQAAVNAGLAHGPTLARQFAALDPDLEKQIEGKGLAASKTFWGGIILAVATPVAAHYGLALDADTTILLMGVVWAASGAVLRYVTSRPIKGLV